MKSLNYFILSILVLFYSCSKSAEDAAEEMIQCYRELNKLLDPIDSKEKFKEIEPKVDELHLKIKDLEKNIPGWDDGEGLSEETLERLTGVVMLHWGNAISKEEYGYDSSKYKSNDDSEDEYFDGNESWTPDSNDDSEDEYFDGNASE